MIVEKVPIINLVMIFLSYIVLQAGLLYINDKLKKGETTVIAPKEQKLFNFITEWFAPMYVILILIYFYFG